jgi:hypothetical protein
VSVLYPDSETSQGDPSLQYELYLDIISPPSNVRLVFIGGSDTQWTGEAMWDAPSDFVHVSNYSVCGMCFF